MAGWDDSTPLGPRPELIDSIIYNESRRNPNAVSPKGAVGLMQVEPATAKDYGVTNPEDLKKPDINRRVGTAYFNDLLKKNDYDERKALIAYNQGPNRKGLAPGAAEYADAVLKGASGSSGTGAGGWDASTPSWDDSAPVSDPNAKLKNGSAGSSIMDSSLGQAGLKWLGQGGGILGGVNALMQPNAGQVEPTAKGFVEKEVEPVASGAGMMAGAAGGAALGAASPIPGGTGMGAVAGAGVGNAAMDVLQGHINNWLFGDPVPPLDSPGTLPGFNRPYGGVMQSGAIGAATEAVPRAVPGMAARIFGVRSAPDIAKDAFVKTETKNLNEQEIKSLGGEMAQKHYREAQINFEKDAQEKAEKATTDVFKEKQQAEADKAKAKEAADSAAHAAEQLKARGRLLGRTPEETAAATAHEPVHPEPGVSLSAPESIERTTGWKSTIFTLRQQTADYLGNLFDDFKTRFKDNIIPKKAMSVTAGTDLDPEKYGRLDDVLKHIAENRSPDSGGTAFSPLEFSPKLKALITDAESISGGKTFISDKPPDPITGTVAIEETDAPKGAKVNLMRQLAQKAAETAKGLTRQSEKDIAELIHDGANRTLEGAEGVPADALKDLKGLNNHWRDYRLTYDNSFINNISKSRDPVSTFHEVFDDNERANKLLGAANAEQHKILENGAADFFNTPDKTHPKGWSLSDIYDYFQHRGGDSVAKNLWGQRFTDEMPFAARDVAEQKMNVATDPKYAADYGSTLQRNVQTYMQENAGKLRTALNNIATALGGKAGHALRVELRNSFDNPQKLLELGQRYGSMPKEELLKMIASTQTAPETSARNALMKMKPGRIEGMLLRRSVIQGLTYSGLTLGTMMAFGHGSPTIIGLGIIDGVIGLSLGVHSLGRMALRNEAIADLTARVLTSASVKDGSKAGALTADLAAAIAMMKAKEKMAEQEKAEKAATP